MRTYSLMRTAGALLLAAVSSLGAASKISAVVPVNGAGDVCPDTPLRITFDDAPTLGTTGTISIYTADGGLADSIDLSKSARGAQPRTLGGPVFTNFPVIISGNEAAVFPHLGVLRYGQEYRISISAEVFGGVTKEGTWTFHTKAAGPAAEAGKLTVAADGSGDFCTVQGAVD